MKAYEVECLKIDSPGPSSWKEIKRYFLLRLLVSEMISSLRSSYMTESDELIEALLDGRRYNSF